MRIPIFLFITFIFNALQSQTTTEALEFLKINASSWACNTFVQGTLTRRLEISLSKNETVLVLKVNQPSVNGREGYLLCQIHLASITEIYLDGNSDCQSVVIKTKPKGIQMEAICSDGEIFLNKVYWDDFFNKVGWMDDNIRILKKANNSNGGQRIINALTFLAKKNGATITESHF